MTKKEDKEMLVMNGIKSNKKERSYSNESAANQVSSVVSEKEQSNEQEKKNKDLESPSGFSTMSPLQKFFFVLSLLLSVLYVVAFAWLIPCKVPDVIDGTEPIVVTEKWKLNFTEIGLSTSLVLIKEVGNSSTVLFGYENLDTPGGGLISIDGGEGKLHLDTQLPFTPRFISCDNLDVDFDGIQECIVIGDGSAAILNQINMTLMWIKQTYEHETASIPAVVPDCDLDGVPDLVVAYSEFSSTDGGRFPDRVSIEIMSGQSSNTIGSRKHVKECNSIVNKLQLWKTDKSPFVIFYCDDKDGFGNFWKISTDDLCKAAVEEYEPDFIRAYKIEEPRYKSFNVLYQPTQKIYSSGEDMLIAWKGGNIVLLDGENDSSHWSYNSNTSAEIRALIAGEFTNNSEYQVAMINSDQESGSMLTILQIETGHKIMNILYPKYFLTEAIPLRNMFFGTDGILVKHIKVHPKVTANEMFMQNNSSNSIAGQPLKKFVIREEYLISHPGCTDNESLKFITSDKVTKFLHQNSTFQNKIESNQVTVAVKNNNVEDSLEIITASTSSIENDGLPGGEISELTTVKLLHLSHALFSKNNTCECTC